MATKIIVEKVGKEFKTKVRSGDSQLKYPYATREMLEVMKKWKEDSLT